MAVRSIQIPQFFYFRTMEVGDTREISMTAEELRPEFLRLALEAQLQSIKDKHADDPAFDFVKQEAALVDELVEFAYKEVGQ